MRVKVEIELGNDAMRDGPSVAEALRRAASVVSAYDEDGIAKVRGKLCDIRDTNGNVVGYLRVGR